MNETHKELQGLYHSKMLLHDSTSQKIVLVWNLCGFKSDTNVDNPLQV